jgi:hypothetical protein
LFGGAEADQVVYRVGGLRLGEQGVGGAVNGRLQGAHGDGAAAQDEGKEEE